MYFLVGRGIVEISKMGGRMKRGRNEEEGRERVRAFLNPFVTVRLSFHKINETSLTLWA